jgi:hypothetical protein
MEALQREADAAWTGFTAMVAAHPTLKGQRLLDLLTEPCQRAIRYSTEATELLKAATAGDPAQVPFSQQVHKHRGLTCIG